METTLKARPGDYIRTEVGPLQVVTVDGVGGYELSTGGYVLDSELAREDVLPESEVLG